MMVWAASHQLTPPPHAHPERPAMFTLALGQMLVEGGRADANLRRAEDRIGTAAAAGADVVLLPEVLDLGWTHPSARADAGPIPGGPACERLRAAARRHRAYVCAGLTERAGERVYNAAVLIDPGGDVLLVHRKLNELAIGHACYDQGDRLGVAHTPLGTLGVMICADAFADGQVLGRALGYMGADVILSPSAWAVPADHDNEAEPYGALWRENYRPVATAFQLWVAGASNVGRLTAGPWAGRLCIGCSLVIGPDGNEVLQGPYGPDADTILYADVEPRPRPARGDEWADHWGQQRQPH
jgi:predicted amidohydrolase